METKTAVDSPPENGLSIQSLAMGRTELEGTPVTQSRNETPGSRIDPPDAEITRTPSSPTQNLQHPDHTEIVSLVMSIRTKVNKLQESTFGVKDDVAAGNRKTTTFQNYLKELIENKNHEPKEIDKVSTDIRIGTNQHISVNDIPNEHDKNEDIRSDVNQ